MGQSHPSGYLFTGAGGGQVVEGPRNVLSPLDVGDPALDEPLDVGDPALDELLDVDDAGLDELLDVDDPDLDDALLDVEDPALDDALLDEPPFELLPLLGGF